MRPLRLISWIVVGLIAANGILTTLVIADGFASSRPDAIWKDVIACNLVVAAFAILVTYVICSIWLDDIKWFSGGRSLP